ncbi:MAG TPA: polysaccharide biosynthesis/export family protein [Gemmatimonadales bacterium]|nr:polysaccharide biosynthesis/export family protein [Gemmatimonadales bacterium]
MKRILLLMGFLVTAPLAAQSRNGNAVQVGDRLLLQVVGEQQLTDTFTVGDGPSITLPDIGAVPLAGISRADVELYLRQQLAKYLKNPDVHARVLIRLSIVGEVEHPGFYAVPADLVLADAMMRAGGPTREADLPKMRIERDGRVVWEGGRLQKALARNLTVDQLDLHGGDLVVVPVIKRGNGEGLVRVLTLLITLPAAIYGIKQLSSSH